MDAVIKVKEWIAENAPLLTKVYENKYVGMLYDRFASLPPKQQRQVVFGSVGGVVAISLGYLLYAYLSLWSVSSRAKDSYHMANMLVQYQKQRRDKSQAIRTLSRNSQLNSPGLLKQYLTDLSRNAQVSPRMITVEEKEERPSSDESKGSSDIRMKRATVVLNRVTIVQMMRYLKMVESGQYDLSVSSIRVTNDDKLRGYMKVDLGVVAYVFEPDES